MKKGLYFSLDGLIAIIILSLFISNVIMLDQNNGDKSIEAYSLSLAAMMEKNMPLSNLSNNTTMLNFFNSLDSQYCFYYEFYGFPPPQNNPRLLFNVTRTGCNISANYYQLFRSILNDQDLRVRDLSYGFRMRVWQKLS
ncbi:MAG: hypothetical protein QXI89_00130 [Candidatus Anstonellales archaeon]